MATRAYWKGYLKLSLVTCPVALFPASSKSEKTRFHQINKKTGHRLRQQMVDEETGRVVDKENKSHGWGPRCATTTKCGTKASSSRASAATACRRRW
jgi:non-homologous end joining protein Ku